MSKIPSDPIVPWTFIWGFIGASLFLAGIQIYELYVNNVNPREFDGTWYFTCALFCAGLAVFSILVNWLVVLRRSKNRSES